MSKYSLYYTLNRGVESGDLNAKQKSILLKFVKRKTMTEEQKRAIVLLTAEHARVFDGHEFDPENFNLPYNIFEDKEGVHFNIDELPNELKWILYKFSTMTAV